MATIQALQSSIPGFRYGIVQEIRWDLITPTNDEGSWIELPDFPDKTIHINGIWTTAGEITIYGANDQSFNPFILSDIRGDNLVKTADYGGNIAENPRFIKPALTAGSGSVSLSIVLMCVRKG